MIITQVAQRGSRNKEMYIIMAIRITVSLQRALHKHALWVLSFWSIKIKRQLRSWTGRSSIYPHEISPLSLATLGWAAIQSLAIREISIPDTGSQSPIKLGLRRKKIGKQMDVWSLCFSIKVGNKVYSCKAWEPCSWVACAWGNVR